MSLLTRLNDYHSSIIQNRWHWLFYLFCRISLAYAFIAAGIVKIAGERFASGLSVLHPMGAYLDALHQTGYYYTFIGIAQILAAVLLLIPRSVTLGALLYLPIITNIWILSYAVRFEGSLLTSPLMVLANIYILAYNFDKIKLLLPIKGITSSETTHEPITYNNRFPFKFFIGVFSVIIFLLLFALFGHDVMPRNSIKDCKTQFSNTKNQISGYEFCECIHTKGKPLNICLDQYNNNIDK